MDLSPTDEPTPEQTQAEIKRRVIDPYPIRIIRPPAKELDEE